MKIMPLGEDVKPLLGLGDTVVDFDILANRPDCQCIWGLARESAADVRYHVQKAGHQRSRRIPAALRTRRKVEVLDHDLCPRYCLPRA